MSSDRVESSERESIKVAEASRQVEWAQPSFMRALFLGTFRLDLVYPYPLSARERPEFAAFYAGLERFLRDEVDPVEIDATGEYPEHVLDGLRRMGAFGMKMPSSTAGWVSTTWSAARSCSSWGATTGTSWPSCHPTSRSASPSP